MLPGTKFVRYMANEFKITDLVDKSALTQLEDLRKQFDETSKSYASLVVTMAKGVYVSPKTIEELSDKQKNYQKVLKELIETQNKLSDIQKAHSSLLKEVEEQTKKNVKQILEEAKANKLNADTELALQKTETERLKQQKLLNQEKKKLKITTEEAISLTNKEVHSINEAKEQNKLLRIAVSQVTDAEDKDNKIRQTLNNQIAKNTEYIRFNSDAYTRQKMAIGSYKNEIKAALVELQNGNRTFKNLGIVAKGFGGILKTNVVSGFNEVSIGLGSMIKGMVGAQAIIGGIQKLFGLIKSGIGSIIDFEAANSKLAAILGTTSKNMKDLIADAQRLGATTKYTASEATNLQIELAKLGFSRKEILQSTEAILKFAQATGAELPEAAALAGAALRMFNADTTETERYVSAMAVATTKSALSFSYLQTAMPIVGPVAKAFNFQIEDTLALLGKLADAGFDASMSATATRNILLNLADGSGKLAKALGGPVKTLPDLVSGLKKLKEQGIDLNSTLELTDKRSVAAFNAFLTAADKIVPLREQITGVEGELSDMADTMADNVQGAIANLSSAWEAFMLSFSNSTGPAKEFLNWISDKIRSIANDLKSPEDKITQIETNFVELAKKDANKKILEAEKEFQSEYKRLLDAGDSEEEAYTKAVIQLKNKRIEVTEQERKELEKMRSGAIYSTQEFENMSWFKNAGAKMFGVYTKEAQKADKAQLEFSKNFFKIYSSNEFNVGIDKIVEKFNPNNDVKNKYNKTLTDEEKRALEKAEKEKLKIRETYQQSEIDLMDDGLEKELAKISFSYNKRIAAIKGNSEEEIAIRENLAEMMQRDLEKYEITYKTDKEKQKIQTKLDVVKEGSKEELDLRLQLLVLERSQELNQTDITLEEKLDIIAKYNKKRDDLEQKYASKRLKEAANNAALETVTLNAQLQEELDILSDSYIKGKISKEEYEKEKLRITEEYAIKQAKAAIDADKKALETLGNELSPEDKLKLEQKIAEAEIALAEKVRDTEVKAANDAEEAWKKKLNSIADKIQMVGEALNSFSELSTAIFDKKIQEVEEEQEANEEAGEKEISRIERLAEIGAITKEDAEARKIAAEKNTAQKEEELAKKKAALQEKQAKFEKNNNIAQVIINTAAAIMKTLASLGWPVAAPFIATTAAMGAVQLATIAAQPIPKYAKGTSNHPGGMAIVGDGGKHEAILTDDGAYVTPAVPTLVEIPKRAVVVPDILNMDSFKYMRSDLGVLMKDADRRGEPVTVNVNNDYSRLEKKTDSLISETRNVAKYMKELSKNAEWSRIASRL